jgi:hypothetical protein
MFTAMAMVALLGNLPNNAGWLEDYSAAQAKVTVAGKPMAVFVGSGKAGWESAVRDGFDPAVSRLLAEKFVCLYVDASTDKGRTLAAAFQVGNRGVVLSDRTGRTQAYSAAGTISRTELSRALVAYGDVEVAQKTDTPKTTTGGAAASTPGGTVSGGATVAPGGVIMGPPGGPVMVGPGGPMMAPPPGYMGGPGMMAGGNWGGAGYGGGCGQSMGGYGGGAGHGCCGMMGGGWGGGGGHSSGCGMMGGGCGHSMGGCGGGMMGGGWGGGGKCCGLFGGKMGGWGGGCGGGMGHGCGGCH